MKPIHKHPFRNFVKKAQKPLQLVIEDETEYVRARPYDGQAKVGDLLGFYVWKFKFNKQEYLIAYRPPPKEVAETAIDFEVEFLVIDFYKVGSHEKLYEELKRYIKEELL